MFTTFWDRLWQIHDDTKELLFFKKSTLLKKISAINGDDRTDVESELDISEKLETAPAKSTGRIHTSPKGIQEGGDREYSKRQRVGLILGPLLFALMLVIPTPPGMTPGAQKMAAVALLMATWWICESIPIAATSLLPLVLFPLTGIMHTKAAAAPYANHLIYLFMGGFIIALSMQRWNLHRRIAMRIVKLMVFSPKRLIFGFMVATAALSAFVSNTATTVMMMPIGLAIITHVVEEGKKEGTDYSALQFRLS